MNKKRIIMPLGILTAVAMFSVVVMLLWNWLMPTIFGLTAINCLQALGIFILSRILFGSFAMKRRRMHGGMKHGLFGKNHLREKWMKMTPEERKEYIKKIHADRLGERFGRCDFFDECDTEDSSKKQ